MQVETQVARDAVTRLRRVRGQLDGIIAMIESGRDCEDVVTQVAAASKALDRAGFKLVASGIRQCVGEEERGGAPSMSQDKLERLFLALA